MDVLDFLRGMKGRVTYTRQRAISSSQPGQCPSLRRLLVSKFPMVHLIHGISVECSRWLEVIDLSGQFEPGLFGHSFRRPVPRRVIR